MSTYVDLIFVPVVEAKIDEYRRLSEMSAQIWLDHGALSYREVQADDVKPGKLMSFPQSFDLKTTMPPALASLRTGNAETVEEMRVDFLTSANDRYEPPLQNEVRHEND